MLYIIIIIYIIKIANFLQIIWKRSLIGHNIITPGNIRIY